MKKLSEKQIGTLLKEAERAMDESRSLTAVFADFAARTGRARGGIRNLYYAILKESKTDRDLQNRYPSLKRLKAERNSAFSKEEEESLFESVTRGVRSGKSVRKTIRELSGGDEKIALRYQNKYRNILKKARGGENYARQKGEPDYMALRRAIDDLFERILKQKSIKEDRLKRENEALKEKIRSLGGENESGKAKEYFLSQKGKSDGQKIEKVGE